MIEVTQPYGPDTSYRISSDGTPLCAVESVRVTEHAGTTREYSRTDREATKARAEHIAEALRHYQASQEAEVTP
uniref:Uncharacterized protein n=1 Tax=uncultured bacterium A1Q1_fos_25 TaxID=1256569 RepID=L7VY17_9BACT|nr:hypothetical protein [uncultured bacterium A1Q1_fos_25]